MRSMRAPSRLRMTWIILLALVATASPALAAEQVLFGPAQFTRTAGPPSQFSQEIALPPTLVAPFRLHVENGSPDGTHRVSSATITLNGTQVAGPPDFNQQVAAFDRAVDLQPNNTLQVGLTSAPGSVLTLTLYGTVPPPTLTSLLPPALPIAEGGTGLLTATISAVQLSPTTLGLISDNPAVATVPPTATTPSGELTTDVPVTGIAPGTATITATLNGSSISSVATVAPSKPTLTSLSPLTLPVGQGASGSLTVTINAVQATDTVVHLASSAPGIVALPPSDAVSVPAGQLDQSFAVFGLSPGSATITAALNGTTAQSQVSVVVPVPTVVSLLPPVLPLTEGGRGTLIVTLNAAQPTDSTVALSTSDPAVVGVPPTGTITVPAQTLTAAVPIQGLALGLATVTASLNGTTATTAIEVLPPPPALAALTCLDTLATAATSLCTLALDATPLTDTVVPLASSAPDVASVPPTVTIAAETLEADFAVTGVAAGMATITAGPVSGTTETAEVTIIPPPPTILSLTPAPATLALGATASLTLTLNAAQPADTTVVLASSAPDVASVPPTVTIPAGSPSAAVTVVGLTHGTATLTAGPLNGTQATSDITVAPQVPAVTALAPETLSLPKGAAGALSLTIAPTQSEPTVLPLGSNDAATVGVPPTVTVPAGASSAAFPVLAAGEGTATLTAGPLNGTSRSAIVTVTPAELLALAVIPASPTIAKGQTQSFTATGTFTDASRRDLTASALWSSSDPAVAAITSGGVATGQGVGQATITAIVGRVSATATVTVTPPVLASLTLSPPNPTVDEGQTLQFQALGTLTDGTTQDLTAAVTWGSSAPAVATITSPGGLASALTPGAATIAATHVLSGLSASTTLTVHLPPPSITGFSPTSGQVGDPITITGQHFLSVQTVTFNGTVAPGVTAQGATSLTVAVPPGATTGPLSVTTAAGTATSADPFVVLGPVDFLLVAAPTTATVLAGDQVSYRITANAVGEFTGSIALTLAGAPIGVSATLSPPQIAPGGVGATLTVAVASSVAISSFTLTLTGSATLNGEPASRTVSLPLTVLPSTTTAFVGRILNATDEPLQGVQITLLDAANHATAITGTTDAGGNFLLLNVPVGTQMFFVDGREAKASTSDTRQYPPVETVLDIVANQPNRVPFTIYLPAIDTTAMTPTPANNPTPIMATSPRIPDLQVEIPANTTITLTEPDGTTRTVTEITITAVPVDRAPMPLPPGVDTPTLFTIQPGGAVPQNAEGGVIIRFPTWGKGIPGQRADLFFFDFTVRTWRVYGQGTVSADGTQVIPDPGVVLPRFAWHFFAPAPPPQVNPNLTAQPTAPGGTKGGEPVDLATGTFTLGKTDLVLPSRLPIVLTRTYRSGDTQLGPFGLGGRHQYDAFLIFPTSTATDQLVLVLPDLTRHAFARQADGTFRNTTDPAMQGAGVTISGSSRLLTFKDGTIWTFDGNGRLISQQDRNGNTVTITRDGQGRVTSLTDPAARQFSLTYSGTTLQITQVTDPLGRAVRYAYDAASRLTSVTDTAGGVTSYTYDSASRLTSITDPRGLTFLKNEYDAQGRVCRQTQADGGVWLFYYIAADAATTSAAQQLLTEAAAGGPIMMTPCTLLGTAATVLATVVVDLQGHPTTSRFNANGYLIASTDPLGQQTTFERALGTNLLLSTTDSLGRVSRFTYDTNGNVTSITDPAGNLRTFTYEPTFNRLTTLTDPLGQVTHFAYDAKGNLSSMTDPLGHTTTITSNAFGQPTATADPLGHTTRFDYDAFGNLATITDPLGNVSTRTYDGVSRLLTQTDPRGKTTTFAYDGLNRLMQLVDARNGFTRFTYDGNGNLLTVMDALNHTITHTYDSMDRLASRSDPVGGVEHFTYDSNGNLVTTTDRKGQTTTFAYDALNRRVKATFADGTTSSFTYDAAGRLVQADDSADPHRPITLAYDTVDRLVNETTALGTVAYEYDALGRRTQMALSGQAPVGYTYDAASRLRSITQAPLNPVSIDYDPLGRRTTLTLPNGVSTEYQYDAASRLTSLIYRNAAGLLGDLTYAYDATGNRTGVGGSFARTLLPDPIASATYDAANRQQAFGDKSMTYDANGNLTSLADPGGATTFTWDGRNRLSGLTGSGVTAAFAYDAFGRRAAKQISGQMTKYLYDGVDIIRQVDPIGSTSYLRSLTIDEALAFTNRDGTYFSIYDPLGSTVAVTDSTGLPVVQYTYDPFGTTASTNPTFPHPFQYTSREHDGPTGLYFYRARYYSPMLHRFTSEDPLGFPGGDLNPYVYVRNNAINHIDPFGLKVDLTEIGRLRNPLERVKSTKRGKELYDTLEQSKATYKIRETRPGDPAPAFYNPRTREVVVDSNFHPNIQTTTGLTPASTERILGHEMGHAATGASDFTGPEPGTNASLNENPIAVELGQAPRTKY